MNKNQENYKNTFSQIHPSDESVERVMNMTKNKDKKRIKFAPAIAAVACLAIVIGSVIGNGTISTQIHSVKNDTSQSNTNSIISKMTDSNILIAYAGEGDTIETKPLELNVATPLKINIKVTDIKDKSEEEIEALFKKLKMENETVSENGVKSVYYITERLDNILLSNMVYDYFAIEVKEPEVIESIEMKCNTDYWKLTYVNSSDEPRECITFGNDLKVDGSELKKIMSKYETNGLFKINIDHSSELCNTIDKNPDIDMSAFDDTLTFVVNYKDGTNAQSVINIGFDKDGTFVATAVE